jgi:hypothetical protein
MRLAITHRFDFGDDAAVVGDALRGSVAWDALRTRSAGPFALPATADELAARAVSSAARARAAALGAILEREGWTSVASYGAGTAVVEAALLRAAPRLRLVLTEFAPATVARLAQLLPEAAVVPHDLRRDEPVAGVDVHLLNRVDTELDDAAFAQAVERFSTVPVIVVATELLTPRAVVRELLTRRRPGARAAGLVRSRGAFEAIFRATHTLERIRVDDLDGWLLRPRPA